MTCEVLTVARLLAAVEELPRGSAGAFMVERVDGRPLGMVLADQNQVCCATIAGQGRRLRELLGLPLSADLAPNELERAMELGALQAALKRHTVESLIRLDGTQARASWVSHRGGGYLPRSTFTAAELLTAVGAQLYAGDLESPSTLDELLPAGTTGASYVIGDDDEAVAVREVGDHRLSVAELTALGVWATSALGATRGFSPAVIARALAECRGATALAWRATRRLVHAMVVDGPAPLARALSDLEHRGCPVVLSNRAPRAPSAAVGMLPTLQVTS